MTILRVHLATIVVTTSYLTLIAFNHDRAGDLGPLYAVLTLILALIGVIDGWRHRA